ncbi:thiamine pyrophosphate-binding protein [Enterococcus quebecensis]|uniref:Thiamine pyrophosphate enzyme N-terminal TPP-binding domain-containing protein n=1 Tax=Enterococcus quebecensis TaxID=903983 RepID=A0A1E5GUK9_9ENTE|nr:thiamine pyrophosphate-binding protein [Enterococcus quebecensis]OEG16349.1 hypothetical protein BCR23_05525 [Enterococcus quebecensis]OJG72780.1 phosphonopyruvate decarboxylase subunit alpha [Enterococcus quebecensis]
MNKGSNILMKKLESEGYNFFTGVPCSLLKETFSFLEKEEKEYYPAIREDSALGLASGAVLAGKKAAVFMQNSGLGYSLNVLTSFNLIYDVPLLIVMSWRGYGNDAVEHNIIGDKITSILDSVNIPYFILDEENLSSLTEQIEKWHTKNKTFVILVKDQY